MTIATPHPVLDELARSWRRRRVQWTLLRMPTKPEAPTGDVDVLVAPGDWSALRETAVETGFVPLPGWDSPRNLILVRYDRPSDCWLVLDVVTSLTFRSVPAWESPRLAGKALAARRDRGGLVTTADGDAFWLLLFHCLLDRGTVDERYRDELSALAQHATESSLGADLLAAAGGGSPEELVSAVEDGRWEPLEDAGRRLVRHMRRCDGTRRRLRSLGRRVIATARRPLLLRRRRGVSLALLGPNGVGKSTLAAGLSASFPFGTRVVYMGVWKQAGGGRLRTAAELLGRPFRLWAGYISAQRHVLLGRLVVFDRYVYEAALPAQPPLRALKTAYFWLLRHAVPPAQRVAIVDVAGAVAYRRKQENPPHELEGERRFYAELAPRLRGAAVVDGGRDAQAVRADVTELVWRELARRWSRGSDDDRAVGRPRVGEPATTTAEGS